jgi:Cu+-exporting ATPase
MEQKAILQVEGMTCANCAQSISRIIEKKGGKEVHVSYTSGKVEFIAEESQLEEVIKGIHSIGYRVSENAESPDHAEPTFRLEWYLGISVVLTLPLLAHMFLKIPILHNAWFQLLLCIPVLIIGWSYFGKGAIGSVKTLEPNMDVLILIGSNMAFIYSVAGMVRHYGTAEASHYLFFETSATIICFVLLGNLIEHRTIKKTTAALDSLIGLQPVKARKITGWSTRDEKVTEVPVGEIMTHDLLLIAEGDQIPADGKIFEGSAWVDESALTGEPLPVSKTINDSVLAGSVLTSGSIKIFVEQAGRQTALSGIIELVKKAQQFRPPVQRLADKISRWFVPAVIFIAIITFLINHFIADVTLTESMMRAIAVLVIACPCAMGLATPTALSAGTGRAAANGILIRNGQYLETLSKVSIMAFDKTGTLTKGEFSLNRTAFFTDDKQQALAAVYMLEQQSNHPLARSIIREIEKMGGKPEVLPFSHIEEVRGSGITGTDISGNEWKLGSYRYVNPEIENNFDLYLSRNGKPAAAFSLTDQLNVQAKELISRLQSAGIRTVLISGDKKSKCEELAGQLGIEEVYSGQLPHEKVAVLNQLKKNGTVAMIGDGINDAGALAVADVSVSFSEASALAMQSANIILLRKHQLNDLWLAFRLSQSTLRTIKQNLFWAFFYNILAIPVAAAGYLAPIIASLSMAFSDVIVIGNSILLRYIKSPQKT